MTDMDMRDQDEGVARGALRLREDRFKIMFALLGATKDSEIAAMTGLGYRTIGRARAGQFGHVFVINTIYALQRHADRLAEYGLSPSLDELFEVVESRTESRAA